MSETIVQHEEKIQLQVVRHYKCGRFYAVEKAKSSSCPYSVVDVEARSAEDVTAAERSVRALRG